MGIEGFQFIHESTYGRKGKKAMTTKTGQVRKAKWSGREIVAEAIRELGSCDHVEQPLPPEYVYGDDLLLFWENIEQLANDAKDTAGRKLRTDKQLLTAGVCSAPILTTDFNPDDEFYQQWLKLNLDFLKNKYDVDLGPVILHTDERYIHLHYYVAPEVQDTEYGFTLEAHHDGLRAKNAEMKDGNAKTSNIAYKQAMKAFQDSYYEQVAKQCGLTRSGPKRRRLSRNDWKDEKRLAAHLPQLNLEMEEAAHAAESALRDFEQAQQRVEQARNQKEWDELQSQLSKEELTEYKQRQHDKITQLKEEQDTLASDFNAKYERNQEMDEDHDVMSMEMQAMAFELSQREKKSVSLQQSQDKLEQRIRRQKIIYSTTGAKLDDARTVLDRAKSWQEKGSRLGAFFSKFNGSNRSYEKQISELKQQLKDQAKKYKIDLSRTVKKEVQKALAKSKGLLELAYKTISMNEAQLKDADNHITKTDYKNQQLQEQNDRTLKENAALKNQLKKIPNSPRL
jgi:hypothetical protein